MKEREMEEREVELNDAMIDRGDELDNAAYQYFLTLLELNVAEPEKVEEIFPWDISILRNLLYHATAQLNNKNLFICNPGIVESYGKRYRCTLSECGCKECHCQEHFMEKERILARVTEAMELNGMEVTESTDDGMAVREQDTGCCFQLQINSVMTERNIP